MIQSISLFYRATIVTTAVVFCLFLTFSGPTPAQSGSTPDTAQHREDQSFGTENSDEGIIMGRDPRTGDRVVRSKARETDNEPQQNYSMPLVIEPDISISPNKSRIKKKGK